MRIFNIFQNTRGFITLWEQMVRFRSMITEQAQERLRILAFREKHGATATRDAFHVSPRTLFRWQAALRQSGGLLDGLNPCSTAPHRRRQRMVSVAVQEHLLALRKEHPRLGKDKLQPLLAGAGYQMSVSTVGRIIADLKHQGRLPAPTRLTFQGKTGTLTVRRPKQRKKRRRPTGYRVLEVDTVVRFLDGVKRYVLTGIDTEKRTAFAACYTNHGSRSAADFLRKAMTVLPDCPQAIQTDNGSEFALHFAKALAEQGLTHFHTYPKSPKMNAHVERFNRTLDEEFLRYNRAMLRDDARAFNNKLIDWLLWYNGERPHAALGQVAPFRAMLSSLPTEECQMWWTHTRT